MDIREDEKDDICENLSKDYTKRDTSSYEKILDNHIDTTKKVKADVCFHLAANCKINKCIENPDWAFKNVIMAHKVLEFCRRNDIKKLVVFSSSRVLRPERNVYTAAKLYLEELCKAYAKCYGIKYIIIRPSTVYGPFNDLTNRLVDIWIGNALVGKNLEIYGDPKTKTLDFTYIDDFVDGVVLILRKNNKGSQIWCKSYNISGGKEINLFALARFIIKETNSTSKISIKPAEIQQPQTIHLNIDPLKKLGYTPKVNIVRGIRRTIKFYRTHNPLYQKYRASLKIKLKKEQTLKEESEKTNI